MPDSTSNSDATRDITRDAPLRALAARRWRVAIVCTALMTLNYFGFIALIAWNKPLLGRLVTRGLSLGILLGALVIVVSWILTWAYARWANGSYDPALHALRDTRSVR